MLDESNHPIVPDFVEKRFDVQVEHPVHFLAHNPDVQRVQRIMLATPRPEAIRKAFEVLFPDLVENCPYRSLYDFIFQRRDPQWSLPPIGFQDKDSPRWLRSICPAMHSTMKIDKSLFQVLSIFFPCHPVHSRRSLFL